jgi:hypothetical protein
MSTTRSCLVYKYNPSDPTPLRCTQSGIGCVDAQVWARSPTGSRSGSGECTETRGGPTSLAADGAIGDGEGGHGDGEGDDGKRPSQVRDYREGSGLWASDSWLARLLTVADATWSMLPRCRRVYIGLGLWEMSVWEGCFGGRRIVRMVCMHGDGEEVFHLTHYQNITTSQ